MSKIIIHNKTANLNDFAALNLVKSVVSKGYISGESQYCWATNFPNFNVSVVASKSRNNTHSFKLVDESL